MEDRRRCTTVRQLELMVEFLEGHRDLALGRVRSKEARAVTTRLWRDIADTLNAEGPARTGKEWTKVWNDHKCRVRAKLVSINANQRATGGGPSNAQTLSSIEERIANILGRDIGPLPNVRQDQFASNNNDADNNMVVEEQQELSEIAPSEIVITEADILSTQTVASPVQSQPLPLSPVPSLTGQAPLLQNTPRRTAGRTRFARGRRRIEHLTRAGIAPQATQSARSALEESRSMILHIEEMRAEASLSYAQAICSFAESLSSLPRALTSLAKGITDHKARSHQHSNERIRIPIPS